jgi:hypothetical protein
MKKLLLLIVSFAFCSMAYAGGSSAETEECKWVQQGECKTDCPVCPKAKAKKCPKAKVKKGATKTVVKWKTRQKTNYVPVEKIVYKYVDRERELGTHTIGVLGGLGPEGIVTDYYDTKERSNEYAFRVGEGFIVGLQYQYRLSSSWSVSATVLSNPTVLGGLHYSSN